MYTKVCSICGKTFETNYHNQTLCTLPHPKQCLNCGSTFYVRGADRSKDYCCENCKIALHSKRCILCGKLFIPKTAYKLHVAIDITIHAVSAEISLKYFLKQKTEKHAVVNVLLLIELKQEYRNKYLLKLKTPVNRGTVISSTT